MNKYEEAFERLKESCANYDTVDDFVTIKELINKYNKHQEYHHPLLKPCTCGRNRRNRYVKWSTEKKHQKLWGYECKGCGFTVWSESEMGAKHEWNRQTNIRTSKIGV